MTKRGLVSWCLYDWANTAFGTVIITFIFSVYFARGVVGDETEGASLWAYAIGFSGFLIALMSPFFGALADQTGQKKPWIIFFTVLCCVFTALLYIGTPQAGTMVVVLILLFLVIANIGLEMGSVFYNAMLPEIAPEATMGRVSGFGWAMGYFGGLVCLLLALFGLVGLGEMKPLLPLPQTESEHIRAVAPLTALWFLLFSLPLFLWVREPVQKISLETGKIVKETLARLKDTLYSLFQNKNLALFLIASAIYRDGLNTLFAVGGLYAAGRFGMSFEDILVFAIGLNVTAGLGAFAFAFMDDWRGSRMTVIVSLLGLILVGVAILLSADKDTFMILAMLLGVFMGPVQAASRTLAGRLATEGSIAQTYGLYAFTGKSIAFVGPLLYGLMTDIFQTQQAGMMVIVTLWCLGLALIWFVRENKA